jgi:hypothetical protein
MKRVATIALAVLALAPAGGEAARVSSYEYVRCASNIDCRYMPVPDRTGLLYEAEAGEANALTMATTPEGRVRVTDPGAVVRAEGRCEPVTPHEALCPAAFSGRVELGDLDDTAVLAFGEADVFAHGGGGDDALTGGAAQETLDGGPGRDRVLGGGGRDVVAGPAAGEPPDAVDGGDDLDTIDFGTRADPVTIVLADFAGFEAARGGAGNDTIVGGPGGESLSGGGGDDDVQGNGGDDELRGDNGSDDPADIVGADCEALALNGVEPDAATFLDPRVRFAAPGVATLRNPCAGRRDRRCRGALRVSAGGRGVTHRFRAGTRRVRVPVPASATRVAFRASLRFLGRRTQASWTAER